MGQQKPKKMYERIAAEIKDWIEQGHVQPGDKLPDMRTLAVQFGVSRATVREAFSSLVGMGLIELRHGEGTFVQKIDVETMVTKPMNAAMLLGHGDLRQLLELRRALETGVAEAAANRAEEADLSNVLVALRKLEATGLHVEERVSADLQFHLALAAAAGNSILYNLLNSMAEVLRSCLHRLYEAEGAEVASVEEHRLIYEAVVAGDDAAAVSRMRGHLLRCERQVLQQRQR